MVTNVLPADPSISPNTLGDGVKGQNSTYSEHGHDVNQFYWNHEMKQHGSKYFPHRHPPYPRGQTVKI